MWEENAEAWTQLSRAGYDTSRDYVNTPAFLAMLPDVKGLGGLDIGCGEGHNTRLLAKRGARMTAVDISGTFLRHARESEHEQPLGIQYQDASAGELPFPEAAFDFATSFMCLMDVAEPERAISEAYRVVKPGGFFQLSITHPCFQTRLWRWVHDEKGQRLGVVCGQYFDHEDGWVDEWIFGAAPAELKEKFGNFRIPRYERTLTEWMHALLDTGFVIERFCEPTVDDEMLRQHPNLADHRTVAYFLIVRCRKPR